MKPLTITAFKVYVEGLWHLNMTLGWFVRWRVGEIYSPSGLFHSFWAESIVRWGENGWSLRKTTCKQNMACLTWPELGSNPNRWDDERFRALKISTLNHSAMGATWLVRFYCPSRLFQGKPKVGGMKADLLGKTSWQWNRWGGYLRIT